MSTFTKFFLTGFILSCILFLMKAGGASGMVEWSWIGCFAPLPVAMVALLALCAVFAAKSS